MRKVGGGGGSGSGGGDIHTFMKWFSFDEVHTVCKLVFFVVRSSILTIYIKYDRENR